MWRLRVCFSCLSSGHHNKQCTFGSCRKCSGKHNTLLHLEREPDNQNKLNDNDKNVVPPETNIQQTENNVTDPTKIAMVINSLDKEHILFGTAMVLVKEKTGKQHECRAFLDSCSQVGLMTQDFCKKLKLPLSDTNIQISGVGNTKHQTRKYIAIELESRHTAFRANVTCLVTPIITDNIPNIPLQRSDFNIPSGITLADPSRSFNRWWPILAFNVCRSNSTTRRSSTHPKNKTGMDYSRTYEFACQ